MTDNETRPDLDEIVSRARMCLDHECHHEARLYGDIKDLVAYIRGLEEENSVLEEDNERMNEVIRSWTGADAADAGLYQRINAALEHAGLKVSQPRPAIEEDEA